MIDVRIADDAAPEPPAEDRFQSLILEASRGSDAAVWQLIQEYEPHLRRVIRRRLSGTLKSKFDTADFVQMVWKSFFFRPELICSFSHPHQLAAFLIKMASNKVDSENRRRLDTQKHSVNREEPLHDRHSSSEHNPSQIAMARDQWNFLLGRLPAHHREVVRLRLEGLTHVQIAERLALNERTSRQIIKDLLTEVRC